MTRLDRTNAVHHVYRCYDENGRLIYVGSSANLFGRLEQHRRTSWWAGQVVNVTAKVYPTGTAAREHERRAIRNEAPRWNKAGRWVTRHDWDQSQWDDWLTMLLRRRTFPSELRRFANLYKRTWGVDPDPVQMAAIATAEEERKRMDHERSTLLAANKAKWEATQREDELALRRERKAARAKAKRLARKLKAARAELAEYDGLGLS